MGKLLKYTEQSQVKNKLHNRLHFFSAESFYTARPRFDLNKTLFNQISRLYVSSSGALQEFDQASNLGFTVPLKVLLNYTPLLSFKIFFLEKNT